MHTCTYLTCSPQGGWHCDMETVHQKSCLSSASNPCQQVTDVFCHQEGQGEHCHYSQLWTRHQLPVSFFPGQLTQALSTGVIPACTDPHSQMKPCMNPSDGRAQSCSLLLPQRLAHSAPTVRLCVQRPILLLSLSAMATAVFNQIWLQSELLSTQILAMICAISSSTNWQPCCLRGSELLTSTGTFLSSTPQSDTWMYKSWATKNSSKCQGLISASSSLLPSRWDVREDRKKTCGLR